MFNFFSNTFSLVIATFAAILGMAFPLILQSIQHIDEKYDSTVLYQNFCNETIYKYFQRFWYPFIACICISPILLGYCTNNIYSYYIQSFFLLYIFIIIILFAFLSKIISVYYNINDLFVHLKKNKEEKDLISFFDITRYAAKTEDYSLYTNAFIEVLDYFKEKNEKTTDQHIDYTQEMYTILYKICNAITNKKRSYLYKYHEIIETLYCCDENKFISDKTYNHIWLMLNKASAVEDVFWLKNYWITANQYYMTKFNGSSKSDLSNDEEKKFYRFNIMLGALFVYYNCNKCLDYIMTYSSTSPSGYILLPGTFSKIVEFALYLDSMDSQFIELETNFSILNLNIGVKTGYVIANQAYHYLALMFIRMWSFNNYDINYSYPLEMPSPDDNMDKNKACIRCMGKIKDFISNWYKNDSLRTFNLSQVPEEATVVELIDSYIEKLNEKNNEIINGDSYDEDKLQNIYKDLTYFNALLQSDLFTTSDSKSTNKVNKEDFNIGSCEKLEKRCLKKECGDENPFIGKILSTRLEYAANSKCIDQLFKSFEYETESIKYTELEQKLASKKLTKDDCIIDISGNINFETDANIYIVGNCNINKCLFICKKKDMPSFYIKETSFTKTNGETSIYPNGKQLIGPNGEDLINQNEKIFIEPKEIDKYNHLYAFVTKSDSISYKIYVAQTITMESPIVEKPHGTLIRITC